MIPAFAEWREVAVLYTNDDDLFDRLGQWHESKGNLKAAVDTWNRLFRLRDGENGESFAFWTQILEKYPDSPELHQKLAALCREEDANKRVIVWTE